MRKISEVIVVEGKTDKIFLESFLEADIVTTNGSEISDLTINMLKELSKTRELIIMTDPDTPGKRIREKIQSEIGCCKHCFIAKEKAIKGKKVGIAETSKKDILEALEKIVTFSGGTGLLTQKDMLNFEFVGSSDSARRRDYFCREINIDKSNGKSLLKKLNMMRFNSDKIKEIMRGYKNENSNL